MPSESICININMAHLIVKLRIQKKRLILARFTVFILFINVSCYEETILDDDGVCTPLKISAMYTSSASCHSYKLFSVRQSLNV